MVIYKHILYASHDIRSDQTAMANPTILVWLPLLLLLPLIFLMKKKLARVTSQSKKLPPGPPKLPIIGNLHQLGPLAHQTLWELSKKYGPVMFLQLGGVPTVIISSSEAAMEVLKIHDLDCCSRPRLAGTGRLSYNYLDVAFSPYGEYWREMRKLCVLELFSTKRVQSFRFVREEETASLINSISQLCCNSGSDHVDLSEKFICHTVNIVSRVAFGKIFRGSERFQELVDEAMAMLGSRAASDFFPYVGWIVDRVSGFHGRLERSFRDMDAFYQKVIDDHLDRGSMKQEEEDIIDVLLRIEKEEAELGAAQITKDHIKAILMNIFLAGVDTGALTMVWAMAELARNPRVMQKAQAEIRSSCVGKKGIRVSESDLDNLHFLKMVVKETLRLHPPAVLLIPRETMSHFKLNGYDIYPKTRVQVNVWGIGRDPTIWEDPEEFFPERFIDSPIDFKGQHFELLPFGSGRRGCPGILMGTSTVELTLANLLYSFDWKLPNGMKEEDINMDEGANQTVYKKVPLHLVPIMYQWSSEE